MARANAREMAAANYTQRRVFPVESKIRVLFCPRVGPNDVTPCTTLDALAIAKQRGFVIYTYNKNNKQSSYLHNSCGFAAFSLWCFHKAKIAKVKRFTLPFSSTRGACTGSKVSSRVRSPRTSELPNSHFFY